MGRSEAPPGHRDRLLPVSGAIACLAVLGVFADYVHPFEPKLLLWVPSMTGAFRSKFWSR